MIKNNGYPGLYIIFEGIGGSGKDTHVALLAERIKREMPGTKFTVTREPGGTPEGQAIRRRLLDHKTLTPQEEVELFIEDRVFNRDQIVLPAMKEGQIVIQNRSWVSNMAYQGNAKGLGTEAVLKANLPVISEVMPDVIVLLDVGWEVGRGRFGQAEHDKYDLEGPEFWQKVELGYLKAVGEVIKVLPTKILTIEDKEGNLDIGSTHGKIWEGLEPHLDLWWRVREGLVTHSFSSEGVGRPQKERV